VVTSPHLKSLTHLQVRCCDGGDVMIADIVASGVLRQLEMLDLRHGHVTDHGARLLADAPDARNLKVLDPINNPLTDAGNAAPARRRGVPGSRFAATASRDNRTTRMRSSSPATRNRRGTPDVRGPAGTACRTRCSACR